MKFNKNIFAMTAITSLSVLILSYLVYSYLQPSTPTPVPANPPSKIEQYQIKSHKGVALSIGSTGATSASLSICNH